MTEDARNSLIALVSVLAIFGSLYLFMWLMPNDVRLPSWVGLLSLPLLLFIHVMRRLVRKRRRAVSRPG